MSQSLHSVESGNQIRTQLVARQVRIAGRVQGVGMRPAVARIASQLKLCGDVSNTSSGVLIHVEGSSSEVSRFVEALSSNLPELAIVDSIESLPTATKGCSRFEISPSTIDSVSNVLLAKIPADLAVCADCLAEIQNSENRRFKYPFTSCTNCGPRDSIISKMPYERSTTTMRELPMCDACLNEYRDPSDRRFHAQTNACPECGPKIWLQDETGKVHAREQATIALAAKQLLAGKIVALRGIGGYQLVVDAVSKEAVARLRSRKQRSGKPFAVMVESVAAACELAVLSDEELALLTGSVGPIVIATKRQNCDLAEAVTHGQLRIGLMLPSTPLHWLLSNAIGRPLVCTSGNLNREPLIFEHKEAAQKLGGIADIWLEHDRPIRRPIDDSVMQVVCEKPMTIRLARGLAPMSLDAIHSQESTSKLLASGGHQKCAISLSNGGQAVLGPHIGDMETVATRERWIREETELQDLYDSGGSSTNLLRVCDQHPEYFTTQQAMKLVEIGSWQATQVQHHHAHIAAGMLEHGWADRKVLGVAFDGTGWGPDQTIWGGEFLLATLERFERVGHLKPLKLAGGEQAILQPWRVAVELVRESKGDTELMNLGLDPEKVAQVVKLLSKPTLNLTTSSVGRLFDGVAAIVLGVHESLFEGQPAMLLEQACDLSEPGAYSLPLQTSEQENQPKQLDWQPLICELMHDLKNGVAAGAMAMRFHRGLANAVVSMIKRVPDLPVVLSGGVFQNQILCKLIADSFSDDVELENRELGLPGIIPVNDGGLAAGQLAIAMASQRSERLHPCV